MSDDYALHIIAGSPVTSAQLAAAAGVSVRVALQAISRLRKAGKICAHHTRSGYPGPIVWRVA